MKMNMMEIVSKYFTDDEGFLYNRHYELGSIKGNTATFIGTGTTYKQPDIPVDFYENDKEDYIYGVPSVTSFPVLDESTCEYTDSIQGALRYWADTTGEICTYFNETLKIQRYWYDPEDPLYEGEL